MLHKQHLSNLQSKILSFFKKEEEEAKYKKPKNKNTTEDRCVCFGFDFSQALSVGETVLTTQETEVKPDC